jgi:hypothetical protein
MNLMLTLIFACIGVGLVAETLDRRHTWLVVGFATVATILWFFFRRFL